MAASAAAFGAIAMGPGGQPMSGGAFSLVSPAWAAEGSGGGGGSSGHGTHGGGGEHESGGEAGATHGSGSSGNDLMMHGGSGSGGGGRPVYGGTQGGKSGAGARPSATGTTHGSGQGGPGEDSDRPIWAGIKGGKAGAGTKPTGAGTTKGDLYGDLWVILRDANGVPILNAAGQVQPIDANGNLIPLDAEGQPLDATLVQTVEFSRLSVARSPTKVLDKALNEAISAITAPGAVITLDPAGRIVVNGTLIDSPLENLALYKAVMTDTLPTNVKALLPANLSAASLLAGAADKTSTITVDTVEYLNSILGINQVTDGVTTKYYDFSSVKYDRAATYDGVSATVLVKQSDGSYVATPVNLYDAVFSGSNWVDPTPTGGAADFAAEANDALRVVEFLHDNSAP
ncbi:MAG: hypothetical protein M0T84_10765 [Betaproteobacteria bacterium]|nr:hypothetical protein [Betaproteobacteria bacterium]